MNRKRPINYLGPRLMRGRIGDRLRAAFGRHHAMMINQPDYIADHDERGLSAEIEHGDRLAEHLSVWMAAASQAPL